ncbi:MAG: hypothetical protein RRA94_13590, partial [Bacteroidota bacterium]|nr:hypothetical protein [Bacteroidota bacterium]
MLRYTQSYRSPFNGPRWGALLMMLVIAAAQVTAALHVPASEITAGDHCCPATSVSHGEAAQDGSGCCASAVQAGKVNADCENAQTERKTQDDCEDCVNAQTERKTQDDCEDCASHCEDDGCGSGCCHHPPLNSPLP